MNECLQFRSFHFIEKQRKMTSSKCIYLYRCILIGRLHIRLFIRQIQHIQRQKMTCQFSSHYLSFFFQRTLVRRLFLCQLIFFSLDMANWIIGEPWLDESLSWFLPPPPQLVPSENNSPLHSFGDYVYPNVERLVSENRIDLLSLMGRKFRFRHQRI